jgi:vancomycin resistance protein YoaR
VVPSVDGQGIDPTELAGQLLPVLDDPAPRSVTAALGPVPAGFTTEQAQALGITEKVSSFTTRFTMSPSATNIRVVAEKVDGALVKPGETFSLNDFTGPRGTAQGYIPANVIEGGQLTKAVGGGISQFATTMFNAEFFAGLQDIHHKTHSFYISRYPAGREATVFDGLIDLAWKNDTDTGIYVQTQWVSGGSITVTFWGTKHVDIESLSGDRRNVTQPAVQDKADDGSCIPQSGSAGFDITVTRVFKDPKTAAEIRRENFNTHYIPEAVIHCVPPEATPPG